MAVSQDGNKLVIFGAAADAVTGRRHIQKMIWVAPTTAGHDILVSDSKGKVLWKQYADATNKIFEIEFEKGFWSNGITLTTLDSGVLHVYQY